MNKLDELKGLEPAKNPPPMPTVKPLASEQAIVGRDIMEKLIPLLNLDRKKLYRSISVRADCDGIAIITTETIASEIQTGESDDN